MTRRTLAPAALLGAVLAGVFTLAPAWTQAAGLDVWNYRAVEREHAAEVERCEALADEMADLARRNAVKRGVICDLRAGRVDLAGAAAEFLRLEEARPHQLASMRAQFPDGSDLKRAARSVLVWARCRGGVSPAEMAKLEAAFKAQFPG